MSKQIKGDLVIASVKTRKERGGQAVECVFTMDFSKANREDILELASRAVVIGTQALLREEKDMTKGAMQTVDVAEFCSRERGSFVVTPDNLAAKAKKSLTPAERATLIRQLQSM
jgi:hypothetical protein